MRPAIFVLLTLVLSEPTLSNVLAGDETAVDAGAHLAGAILVSWVAVTIVSHLLDNYRAAAARRAEHRRQQAQHT